MKEISRLKDERINADNSLVEITVKEYLEIARNILDKNEYQRKRVRASSTVYSLLKQDLITGCVIPPLVLAEVSQGQEKEYIILDGLQRTYILLDIQRELTEKNDTETLTKILERKLRVEIYSGLNRSGLLYRMLTLNTGQTPVTLRHQIEILYLDYLDQKFDDIRLIRETDNYVPTKIGEYQFKDVVDGFNAYLDREILPMDRVDVLDNIRGMSNLAEEKQDRDLFRQYILTYNKFIIKINGISNAWTTSSDQGGVVRPFGKNIIELFSKSQAMTGFGSAIGKLKEHELISDISDIDPTIEQLSIIDAKATFDELIFNLDQIKLKSKRIGLAQRLYFHYLFRELLNKESDSYLKMDKAVKNGYSKYLSQTA